MLKSKQKTCMRRIGVLVGIVVMMLSGLALAQDVPERPRPSAAERHSNDEITGQQESRPTIGSPEGTPRIDASRHGIVPPGMECCVCAQDEVAFENMVAAACRTRYQNAGVDAPTETQLQDCITKLKADVLKNCPKTEEEQVEQAAEEPVNLDLDGDGITNYQDNCPYVPNPLQKETDSNVKMNGKCRFIDNGDATITDFPNRLVWRKYPGSVPASVFTNWATADSYCNEGGWRLPSEKNFMMLTRQGWPPSGHPFLEHDGDPETFEGSQIYWTDSRGSAFNLRTREVVLEDFRARAWAVRDMEQQQ
jgi:hypothetical protein